MADPITKDASGNIKLDDNLGVDGIMNLMQGFKPTTTTSSSTQTTGSNVSKEGMDELVRQILGSNQGLAAVALGQKTAGLYNSPTNTLLVNDLITQTAAKLAVAKAGTTTQTSNSNTTPAKMNAKDMAIAALLKKLLGGGGKGGGGSGGGGSKGGGGGGSKGVSKSNSESTDDGRSEEQKAQDEADLAAEGEPVPIDENWDAPGPEEEPVAIDENWDAPGPEEDLSWDTSGEDAFSEYDSAGADDYWSNAEYEDFSDIDFGE